MFPLPIEPKDKPFRLIKFFSITSFILILIITILLSLLNTHVAKTLQLKKSEDYALLLSKNLNHQLIVQFIVPVSLQFGGIQLEDHRQFDHLDKVVKTTLHSFKVDMVNIYNMKNKIIYSFDPDMIGKKNYGGTEYYDTIAGKPASKLLQRGNWLQLLIGMSDTNKIITYAPLHAERPFSKVSYPIIGVVEIVQDLSEDYKRIFRFQILVIISYTIVMSALFFFLFFVVKKGEEIIQKQTVERIKLKEELSRAKHLSSLGEMVAGVSHEIRNPLGIIRSSADLLKKKMSGSDSAGTITDIIIEESSRLNNIITDFLSFARPKNPVMAPCMVDEVLEKNITFLKTQPIRHSFSLKKNYHGQLPETLADYNMLYQAFLNILINAMQSMPDGGIISITINTDSDNIIVSIEDKGKGIPEELMEKIWDPFFTTKIKGTGLGLGIVKNIIEAHGGSIRFKNNPLKGAICTIKLSLKHGE